MRRAATAIALTTLAALAAGPALAAAGDAPKGEVRTFQRLDRAPTPGEMVAVPAFELPQIDGPNVGFTPDPRVTADAGAVSVGGLSVEMRVAGDGYYATQTPRSRDLLGAEQRYEGFDRSNSIYSYYGYGRGSPFAAYSPGWRDYSFARSVSPSDIAGLPSVSAPRSFWGFRD